MSWLPRWRRSGAGAVLTVGAIRGLLGRGHSLSGCARIAWPIPTRRRTTAIPTKTNWLFQSMMRRRVFGLSFLFTERLCT